MFDSIRAKRLTRKAQKINAGRVTVADFLRNLGVDEVRVRQYGSAFGTRVSRAYQAANDGVKPVKTGAAVVKMGGKSRLVTTYAYRWDELGLLTHAAIDYQPIAALIGARVE